jgi:hypothetical protein
MNGALPVLLGVLLTHIFVGAIARRHDAHK